MQRSLHALALALCSLLWLAAIAAHCAAAERRVALVIGNATYKNPALSIPNARNDAEDVAAALTGLGFDVLLQTDVDQSAATRAMRQFERMSVGADAALFYFAGHAVQFQGHNYLLPTDAEVNDDKSIKWETIAVDDIRGVLDSSNGVKIMVLDACRTNPISDRLAKLASAAPAIDPSERTRGLQRVDKSEGIIVAFATSPGDVALDGQDRNSPFTKAFLRRLNEPGLEIEMMFRRIANDVSAATGGRQRPETFVSLVNEYYLNQNDRIAWDKIRGSDDPAALHDFLERFPSSFYAIEARYRLQALERALADAKDRALREAEITRREKDIAAQEAAARQKAEEACRADRAALAGVGQGDAEGLRRLSAGACDEVKALAQKRLSDLAAALAAEAESCRRDGAALAKLAVDDLDGLRSLMQATSCGGVKTAAASKIGALEANLAKQAETCRSEDGELKGFVRRGDGPGLEGLRGRAKCPATLAGIAEGMRALADAAKAACAREDGALKAIPARDVAALRDFLGKSACEQVKTAASARLTDVEALLAREAALCQTEAGELKSLTQPADAAKMEALRGRAKCPAIAAAADQALRDFAAAADAACARDNAALNKIGPRDVEALRALSGATPCGAVKTAATERLADATAALAHEAEVCKRDEADLKALATSGNRADLEALRQRAECAAVKPAVERRLADLKTICGADGAALTAIGPRDADGLRGLIGKAGCDDVKAAAQQRLAKLNDALAQEAQQCQREEALWKDLANSGNRADLEAFGKRAECASVKSAAERRLADLVAICRRDEGGLSALGARDADGLRAFVDKEQCNEVKTAAQKRLAKLEGDLKQEAEACQRDEAKWNDVGKDLANPPDRASLAALRQGAKCPSVIAAIDRALTDLKTACAREQSALAAIGQNDGEATKTLLAGAVCDDVKTAARAKIAKIEADEARQEEACRREDVALTALKTEGADARDRLVNFKRTMTCARLRPDLDAARAEMPEPAAFNTRAQILSAQAQLQRLGCLASIDSGKLDSRTQKGLARYFEAKGDAAPAVAEIKITDEFLGKLQEEKADICAPNEPAAEKPSRRQHENIARIPPKEAEPREEPRQKAVEPRPPREKAARPAPAERPVRAARSRPEQPRSEPARSTASSGAHGTPASSALGVGF